MKLQASTYFLVFLIVFAMVFIGYSLTFPPPQAKMVGLFAGSMMLVLGVIQLVIEIRKALKSEGLPEPETVRIFWQRAGKLTFWIGGFVLTTYLIGFLVSSPLFILAYLKTHQTRWPASIMVTIATTGLIYGLFEVLLERELWRGFLIHLI